MFHDLNDLFFIFYEKTLSNTNNVTKKIYLKNFVKRNNENSENSENSENVVTNKQVKKHNKTIKNN